MTNILITPEEKLIVLSTIDGLPPSYLLKGLNEQQTAHWYAVREKFGYLSRFLRAYFSGESTPLIEGLTDYDQEFFELTTDFYIKLYNVLHWGWHDILKCYSQNGSKSTYGDECPYHTPGEMLAAILERNAAADYFPCKVGRLDVKPRKNYDLHLGFKKRIEGELTPKQQKKHETEFRKLIKPYESLMELEISCVAACRLALKSQENKKLNRVLNKAIKEYESSCQDISTFLYKHHRNSPGFAWENGQRLETIKHGGTYRPTS